MIKIKKIIILIFLTYLLVVILLSNSLCFDLHDFYSKKLQFSFFTGFLTVGGFLLSLKTFILVKLKEGLFDNKEYQERMEKRRALNPDLSYYGPLSRLGSFLIYCVFIVSAR